jgi:hypothetical protein
MPRSLFFKNACGQKLDWRSPSPSYLLALHKGSFMVHRFLLPIIFIEEQHLYRKTHSFMNYKNLNAFVITTQLKKIEHRLKSSCLLVLFPVCLLFPVLVLSIIMTL